MGADFLLFFNCFILFFIGIDFFIISRNPSLKISLGLTVFWILAGLLFSFYFSNSKLIFEYLSAYFIEKSLSLDNIFVFLMIFSKFGIDYRYQHKILFLGIFGALFFRYLMIAIFGELIDAFHFMIPVLGVMLLYTGISSFRKEDSSVNYEKFFKKFSKYIEMRHDGKFFVNRRGRLRATILVFVLMLIEISDVIFAFDSIPAIFSVTSDKTIIYSSNALAIIGLRSLYGVFSAAIGKMRCLKYAVSIILCGVGVKMIFADWVHIGAIESLVFILVVLSGTYVWSKIYGEN